MASLVNKIKKYVGDDNIDFGRDVTITREGDGVPFIQKWNLASHPEPIPEELSAVEDDADAYEASIAAEYDAQEYARKRQAEYPSIGDQMDMIYKDMKNGTSTHADAVEVVKVKYPKG